MAVRASVILMSGLLLFVGSQRALAEDDGEMPFDPQPTITCIEDASELAARQACVGRAADACMSDNEEGFTTIGMMSCIDQERDWWDARLNAVYGDLMAQDEAHDREYVDLGSAIPHQAPALRGMQRAWIPYRDARCEYALRQWGGGSGGGPAVLSCLLKMTGDQALYLEGFLTDE